MEFPGFCSGSYVSQSPVADQEETINYFFEPLESPGATSRAALYPTPGVTELFSVTVAPGRAHFYENGRAFAVEGTTFYEEFQSSAPVSRGTVAIGADPATISSNGDGGGELFITSGSNGYVFDKVTNVFTQVVALNGVATMGGHLDGYFLALDRATSKLKISDLLDGLTWDPTQFAQRSRAPDPWRSMRVVGIYIWLLGEVTSEVWYDTGASPFPFAPYPSLLIPYGIVSTFSAAVADGPLVWLGTSANGGVQALQASGFSPEVVSDYPRDLAFSSYGTVNDAVGEVINYLGHSFYLLTFPTQDITHVYDLKTRKWTKWLTWNSEDNEFVAFRPRWHAYAFGEHRMLDASTGSIYRLTSDVAMDVDGRPIRRVRRAPSLINENNRVFFPGFELLLEPGLGAVTGQGSNPMVMMRQSTDGGKTWGTERMASAGPLGKYLTRVRWNRCGMARQMVFEVVMTDPIPYRLIDAFLTPDPYPLQQRGQ